EPAQCRREQLLALVGERNTGEPKALEDAARPGLLPGDQGAVKLISKAVPVTGPTGVRERLRGTARPGEPLDVSGSQAVLPGNLDGGEDATSHPAIGGLVMHPEEAGRRLEIHPTVLSAAHCLHRCLAPFRHQAISAREP